MSGAVLAIDIGSNTIKCLLGRVENCAVAPP
jgi:cell division ATPase FtsA